MRPLAAPQLKEELTLESDTVAVMQRPAPVPAPTPPRIREPAPDKVTLSADTLFALDSYKLRPNARETLDELVARLRKVDFESIKITGHTDPTGTVALNHRLSRQRAEEVKRYLVAHGVSADKIRRRGRGQQHADGDRTRLRDFAAAEEDRLLSARPPRRYRGDGRDREAGEAVTRDMPATSETRSMAVFCDFENVALGVRDAKYDKFDIGKVLERLLLKGSIVVKKAYCDWERYKTFKAAMHEAAFELIEIPHVRQSGKNSADIRMVVDALDLCYTKAHVGTFVIVSGDSDFSPLVSKLRENDKEVIGVGVKQSSSDLLINSCDEFIYYDDLVREDKSKARRARKKPVRSKQAAKAAPEPESAEAEEAEEEKDKSQQAMDLVVGTFEALVAERGEDDKIWGSMIKQALKRRKPGFNESYYGFKSFNSLLEEAKLRGLLDLERDDKSGGYVVRASAQEAELAD